MLGAWLEAQAGPVCSHACGHQLCPSWYPALALGLSSLGCAQLPPACVGLVVKSHAPPPHLMAVLGGLVRVQWDHEGQGAGEGKLELPADVGSLP